MVRETNKPAHASSLEHSKLIILTHAVNDSANYASLTFIPLSGLWFPSVCTQNKKSWKTVWHFLHVKQLNFVSLCPDVAFAHFSFSHKEMMMLASRCHAFLIGILVSTRANSRACSKSSLFPPGEVLEEFE